MKRRDFLKGMAVAGLPSLGATLLPSLGPSIGNASERPLNILLLLADDQRNDTLGCAGHPFVETPEIDRLAAEGTLFENAFVTTPICPVSRASILTGLPETTHGFTFGAPALEGRFTDKSYPRILRTLGYQTGFIGKYGMLTAGDAPAQMFDYFHPLDRTPYVKTLSDGGKRHTTDLIADRALDFLNSQKAGAPFCLSISFNAPHAEDSDLENHYPYPENVTGLYDDIVMPPPALSDPAYFDSLPPFLKESLNRVRHGWRWDTPEKYQKNMRDYFHMITGIDRSIARIMTVLRQLGLNEDTLVVYTADNGYFMGDRGLAGKWTHYEQSIRVPMIIRDPRATKRGQRRLEMVLNIDLAPTFLAAASGSVAASGGAGSASGLVEHPGRSLLSLTRQGDGRPRDDGRPWRDAFFCEHRMQVEGVPIPRWEGVRTSRHVYARYFDFGALEQEPPFEFLHDLVADPTQKLNSANDPGSRALLEDLRSQTDSFRQRYLDLRDKL